MDLNRLDGSMKVAILLKSMDAATASRVLTNMDSREREIISGHLSQLDDVSEDLVERIAQEFTQMTDRRQKRPAVAASDAPDGQSAQARQDAEGQSTSLRALRSIDADQLLEMIRDEHPQTIAVIVVHLKSEVASEVLSKLPDNVKVDVAMRIASLDKVISGMVEEIDRIFEDILSNKKNSTTHKTGGVNHLAEILNQTEGMSAEMILGEIEENNPELAAQIKQLMFVFEDIILVDDRGMQKVFRQVETATLALALKGASEEVRDKVLRNMSERAGEMLMEEIESLGAVRMKDVEASQQAITKIVQEMEAKGELIISGRRGEEFIA